MIGISSSPNHLLLCGNHDCYIKGLCALYKEHETKILGQVTKEAADCNWYWPSPSLIGETSSSMIKQFQPNTKHHRKSRRNSGQGGWAIKSRT